MRFTFRHLSERQTMSQTAHTDTATRTRSEQLRRRRRAALGSFKPRHRATVRATRHTFRRAFLVRVPLRSEEELTPSAAALAPPATRVTTLNSDLV